MERDEETEMLKRVFHQLFGADVTPTPVLIENIREIYHLRMADAALNGKDAA